MAIRKGLPAKNAATDANDTRYDFNNLVVCDANGVPRGGVTAPYAFTVMNATASMNVSVTAFNAVAARDGGAVLLSNDGPVNVLLDAAPAANSRIDLVYAKQNDSSSTVTSPDANDTPLIGVVKGTAAALPVKPALPVGAVELGSVQVPAGVTATNQDGVVVNPPAQFTAAPGGAVPFRTVSLMNGWTTAQPNQLANVFADSTVTNGLYMYVYGTGWQAVVGDTGWINVTYATTPTPVWHDYSAPSYGNTRYRRKNGLVYIEGMIAGGTVTPATLITTLPAGFRPGTQIIRSTVGSSSGNIALEIFPTGPVKVGPTGIYQTWTNVGVAPWLAEN